MQIPSSEISALLQAGAEDALIFRSWEQQRDIQSLVAILENQPPFTLNQHNQGRLSQGQSWNLMPKRSHKGRYLGYLLLNQLHLGRPLRLYFDFGSEGRHIPLTLVLKGFLIVKERRLQQRFGPLLQQPGLTDQEGCIEFALPPLQEVLTAAQQLTGFHVYLIRSEGEETYGPNSAYVSQDPMLHSRKTIDIKV